MYNRTVCVGPMKAGESCRDLVPEGEQIDREDEEEDGQCDEAEIGVDLVPDLRGREGVVWGGRECNFCHGVCDLFGPGRERGFS